MKYFFRGTIVSGTVSGWFNGKIFKALVLTNQFCKRTVKDSDDNAQSQTHNHSQSNDNLYFFNT